MRACSVVLSVLVMTLALSGSAWCGIESGQLEVAMAGSFMMDMAGSNTNIYTLDASVHKLFTEYFAGGLRVSAAGIGDDTRSMDLWGTLDLYMQGASTSIPYFGAGFGRSSWKIGDYDDSTAIIEGHLGVKSFVTDRTALTIEARYEAATEAMDDGFLGLHVGYSVFF